MLRRIALITFTFAVAFVVACGHQVTPEPNNNDLSGTMLVTFRTNGAINTSTYTYAVVIDTCGLGTPYPNVYNSSFLSYSYSFVVGGTTTISGLALYQYLLNPGSTTALRPVDVPLGSNSIYTPDYQNQTNVFQVVFPRAQLNNPLTATQPCPNITPGPTSSVSPTASAGTSPTASPSPSPTSSGTSPTATPTASGIPVSMPTTSAQATWAFNFFVINTATNTVLDSLGEGGPSDTTYSGGMVDTNQTYDVPVYKQTGGSVPADPAAQISGGDIQNYR